MWWTFFHCNIYKRNKHDINSSHDFSNVVTAQAASLLRILLLKFEPKVSNFPVTESGKPVSVTTATGKVLARVYVMFVSFINIAVKKCSSHIKSKKQNFFVAKVIEASDGFYYRQNLRPQAQILAKRPDRGYWRPRIQKKFCFLLFIP